MFEIWQMLCAIGLKVMSGRVRRPLKADLDISGPLDVLAVVAPRLGGAEPLGAQLAVEHPGHLDAVGGL